MIPEPIPCKVLIKKDINIKYSGFEVEDQFLVGYGLDYDERYRNLPFIGVLKPEVYQK